MTLAHDLGWPNPDAMLATMSQRHLMEWIEFYRQDIKGRRADLRSAIVAHTVYQMLGGTQQRSVESFCAVDHGRAGRLQAFKLMMQAKSNAGD